MPLVFFLTQILSFPSGTATLKTRKEFGSWKICLRECPSLCPSDISIILFSKNALMSYRENGQLRPQTPLLCLGGKQCIRGSLRLQLVMCTGCPQGFLLRPLDHNECTRQMVSIWRAQCVHQFLFVFGIIFTQAAKCIFKSLAPCSEASDIG